MSVKNVSRNAEAGHFRMTCLIFIWGLRPRVGVFRYTVRG